MINSVIDKIVSKQNYSIEEIVEKYNLTNNEFVELLNYICENDIPEVRISSETVDFIDMDLDNINSVEKDMIELYLNDFKEGLNKTKISEKLEKTDLVEQYLYISVRTAVEYIKIGFNFLDIVQESTLGLIDGIETLGKSNCPIDFWLKSFCVRSIIKYQKKILSNFKSIELAYLLYTKIMYDKSNGMNIDDISKESNLDKDYINEIINLFSHIDKNNLDQEDLDVIEQAANLTKYYIISNIPKKLNYIDERILMMSYGLEGEIIEDKEIAKILDISTHYIENTKQNALMKLAVNLKVDLDEYKRVN